MHTEPSESYHPSVSHLLRFFEYEHLPPRLAEVSQPFYELAYRLADALPVNPETTVCLRKLLEAKDCAVRSMLTLPSYEKLKAEALEPDTKLEGLAEPLYCEDWDDAYKALLEAAPMSELCVVAECAACGAAAGWGLDVSPNEGMGLAVPCCDEVCAESLRKGSTLLLVNRPDALAVGVEPIEDAGDAGQTL